ncbi:hypothetical protein COX97_00795 [Candidatus Pacearchaeota archaeon CG_4_10_14_0_2_um_filter_05_32_18]|nr:MAG: hypothetical protein AUJ62_02955 [Candidatus Pacearchaeota archaeon CG1_02_32_21]PIZ83623.1 MAG: hypothetical protein COX97_00795 [Candidatus Pacearchaeota archaeon CG_4_10_14_0_2_um_filter_05_32_18]
MKKKIILGYDFLKELGGLERVMFFQANSLYKLYDVELIFSYISDKTSGKITKELNLNKNIPVKQISKIKSEFLQYISSILFPKRLTKIKSDLIISHSFMYSIMAMKSKKINNTPYIVTLYHPPNFLYNTSLKWANNLPRKFAYLIGLVFGNYLRNLDKKAVKNADATIVISKYTAKRVKEIYGINPTIIYPVLAKNFKVIDKKEALKHLEKFNLGKPYVLLHGRMIKDKMPDMAIKAFHIAQKKLGIDLVISGTIEEEENIKRLIKNLGIEKRVHILSRVSNEELVSLYNMAKCFLMSAPKEDFGLTPIEAMACGCPVIAWKDDAGPEETIIDGKTGYLAKPYSIDDFANKIILCLKSKQNKKEISKSVNKFSEENIKSKFLKTINKLNF